MVGDQVERLHPVENGGGGGGGIAGIRNGNDR